MTSTTAHCLSLPLFTVMQRDEQAAVEDASVHLQECIERLKLNSDIEVVIVVDHHPHCSLLALTKLGENVLHELKCRSEFPPCPPGECDYGAEPNCLWCGHERPKS